MKETVPRWGSSVSPGAAGGEAETGVVGEVDVYLLRIIWLFVGWLVVCACVCVCHLF